MSTKRKYIKHRSNPKNQEVESFYAGSDMPDGGNCFV